MDRLPARLRPAALFFLNFQRNADCFFLDRPSQRGGFFFLPHRRISLFLVSPSTFHVAYADQTGFFGRSRRHSIFRSLESFAFLLSRSWICQVRGVLQRPMALALDSAFFFFLPFFFCAVRIKFDWPVVPVLLSRVTCRRDFAFYRSPHGVLLIAAVAMDYGLGHPSGFFPGSFSATFPFFPQAPLLLPPTPTPATPRQTSGRPPCPAPASL